MWIGTTHGLEDRPRRTPKHWGQPCPTPHCSPSRLMDRGTMSAISPSLTQSGTRRLCRCRACAQPCAATRDTVFLGLRSPEEQGLMALQMLLVTGALSALGFVLGVTADTVLEWRRRAAQQAHEINTHLLRALPVTPRATRRDVAWHPPSTGPAGRPGRREHRRERRRAAVGLEQCRPGVSSHPRGVCWSTDV